MLVCGYQLDHLVEIRLDFVDSQQKPDVICGKAVENLVHPGSPGAARWVAVLPFQAEQLGDVDAFKAQVAV